MEIINNLNIENKKINHKNGVYYIINKTNSRRYIGSTSQGFTQRWREHKYDLETQRHYNLPLLQDWNEYGDENFNFVIAEIVENKEDILKAEQKWIDLYSKEDPPLYNNSMFSESTKGVKCSKEKKILISDANSKEYYFSNPNGDTIYIKNLTLFCIENGLSYMRMRDVFENKRNQHKGWTVVGGDKSKLIKRNQIADKRSHLWKIISPDNIIYDNVDNLSKFCKIKNLSQPALSAVANGKYRSWKGWKAYHVK